MGRYAQALGIQAPYPLGDITVDGKRILFLHGDDEDLMTQALGMGAPYLLHGHTHVKCDAMQGVTRVINPGAFCRTHGNPRTVARLVPATGELRFIDVD
jgi:predicted phosphodiesterase